MKITAIKQQVKNPERASIFIDGKYSFSLTLDELVRERLKNDEEIDGSRLKKLKKISEDGKIRMRALAWAMNRPHSVREFRDYLYRKKGNRQITAELFKKGLDRETIDQAMQTDADDEMARLRSLITKKMALPRYQADPQKLAQYLMRQGFSYLLIKEALALNQPED
jgi:regulatory protein